MAMICQCSITAFYYTLSVYPFTVQDHFSQATISMEIGNFLICFCSFDLFCPILKKDNFINFFYIVLSCLIKYNFLKPCLFQSSFKTIAVLSVLGTFTVQFRIKSKTIGVYYISIWVKHSNYKCLFVMCELNSIFYTTLLQQI